MCTHTRIRMRMRMRIRTRMRMRVRTHMRIRTRTRMPMWGAAGGGTSLSLGDVIAGGGGSGATVGRGPLMRDDGRRSGRVSAAGIAGRNRGRSLGGARLVQGAQAARATQRETLTVRGRGVGRSGAGGTVGCGHLGCMGVSAQGPGARVGGGLGVGVACDLVAVAGKRGHRHYSQGALFPSRDFFVVFFSRSRGTYFF